MRTRRSHDTLDCATRGNDRVWSLANGGLSLCAVGDPQAIPRAYVRGTATPSHDLT